MFKLDKTYSTSGNIFEDKKETYYKNVSKDEIGKIFAYLNSVSYNYPLSTPPRMVKTIFSSRKM